MIVFIIFWLFFGFISILNDVWFEGLKNNKTSILENFDLNFATLFGIISLFWIVGKKVLTKLTPIITIKDTSSHTQKSFFSTEQFENEFNNILEWKDWYSNTYKGKKILFVFDNIDRCEPETVKEILMTVKTFLNQDNCVFLLPIDYENICKSYENYDRWDEYLRKIFNLWINLKQPHYSQLSDFIMKLMKANLREDKEWLDLKDTETNVIAYVLSSIFADNPRKIKQFLNQLWAEYILYDKQKSILSILKELIIRLKIPKLYNYLTEDQNIIYANEKLEDFINNKTPLKDKDGKDENFTEREQILLNKLWWIEEKLELLNYKDENIKLEKTYNSPADFLTIIERDNLKDEAKNFLYSHIEPAKKSGTWAQKDLLETSIYYMSKYWIDEILFKHLFKGEFCETKVMNLISLINRNILYKFIKIAWEEYVNKLPNIFIATFTNRFFISTEIDDELNEFRKLNENIQNSIINNTTIISYYKDNEDHEHFKESNVFKFLQSFPKYVNDTFIKSILDTINTDTFNFESTQSNNIITVLALWEFKNESLLNKIFKLADRFKTHYSHYINDYPWNHTTVDSYLKCSNIIIKFWNNQKDEYKQVINDLFELYNQYSIEEFTNKVYILFQKDLEKENSYRWPYADIIINSDNKDDISKLIKKTYHELDTRKWLTDKQIEIIIDKILNKNDWDDVIKFIWENQITKDSFFKKITWINDDEEKINIIKKLDDLQILSENDKKEFWNDFTKRIREWLSSPHIEDMAKVCDFIKKYHNSNIIQYVDYIYIQSILKAFDINKYKWELMANVFEEYKNERSKTLKKLREITKKFNNN